MGLTKIHAWSGEAEILGGLYNVAFDNGTLTIKGLDLDGGYAVLDALAAKTILSVRVKGKTELAQQTAPVPPPATLPKTPWNPKEEFPDEPPQPVEKPVEKAAAPPPVQAKAEPPKEEPPFDMTEEKPAPKAPVEPGAPAGVEEIAGAPNLISVLTWVIQKNGLKPAQTEQIVEITKGLQPHVGILRRLGAKLPERVHSTLKLYAEGGGV